MAQWETTKALWDEVRAWGASRGYTDLSVGDGKGTNHPVVRVNWFDVIKWCNARSEMEGLAPCYMVGGSMMKTGQGEPVVDWTANGYRLPTEAEWEKASRGGLIGTRFPWGESISHSQANNYSSDGWAYDVSPTRGFHPTYAVGNQPYTSPVGSFAANGYGLHDMAGNVSEWCWDLYGAFYPKPYDAGAPTDPKGSITGSVRVLRGGAWGLDAFYYGRVAFRDWSNPSFGSTNYLGFRLVRGL
jgi:formylglycine-generating enzyme required for sulfatase activity